MAQSDIRTLGMSLRLVGLVLNETSRQGYGYQYGYGSCMSEVPSLPAVPAISALLNGSAPADHRAK